MERRKFLTITGLSALTVPFLGINEVIATEKGFEGHKFAELGYAYNALEPYIDAQTMELHYTKHHKGYFDKFIAAAEGTDMLKTPLEKIFASIGKQSAVVRNNGGGYYNHNLFWKNMTPSYKEMSSGLKSAIEKDFGTVENFKEKFSTAAKTHFGSGWAWLSKGEDGKLFVSSTANQDNPLMDVIDKKGIPLLALDVWEHAYYLKYQNKRVDYVDNFWKVVNWEVVEKRLNEALK